MHNKCADIAIVIRRAEHGLGRRRLSIIQAADEQESAETLQSHASMLNCRARID